MFIYSHRRGDWKRSECPFKLVISRQLLKKKNSWDFPGSPVVKTLLFHCRGVGLSPGQGIKILHALMSRPKTKKKKKKIPKCFQHSRRANRTQGRLTSLCISLAYPLPALHLYVLILGLLWSWKLGASPKKVLVVRKSQTLHIHSLSDLTTQIPLTPHLPCLTSFHAYSPSYPAVTSTAESTRP